MPYAAEISRANPSCFIFLVDQSGSMGDPFAGGGNGRSKAQELADTLNRLLQTLVTRCAKGEEVRDYFDVGIFGYGHLIGPVLDGPLAGRGLVKISEIAFNPARLETRMKKVSDGAGGLVEQTFQFPVWVHPAHTGGTPMCEALRRVASTLSNWVTTHSSSYPPTVIHVTDGESSDGAPTAIASEIQALATDDGPVCLFNLHLSSTSATPVTFPGSDLDLPDQFARLLFDMSSPLPDRLRQEAISEGYPAQEGSRGFAFNADLVDAIRFIDIGTRVGNLR